MEWIAAVAHPSSTVHQRVHVRSRSARPRRATIHLISRILFVIPCDFYRTAHHATEAPSTRRPARVRWPPRLCASTGCAFVWALTCGSY